MRALGLVGAVLLLGCPGEPGEGVFVCTMDNQCPPGWVCAAPYCYSERPDAGVPVVVDTRPPSRTYTFVIQRLQMYPGTETSRAGFNLDGSEGPTAGCAGADYLSDVTSAPGVDNSFVELWTVVAAYTDYTAEPYGPRSALHYRVGVGIVGIEVSGVDSLSNDPLVHVRVLEVNAVGELAIDEFGLLAGGTYRTTGLVFIDEASQIVGSYLGPVGGSVSNPFPLPFDQGGATFGLPIQLLTIGGRLRATGMDFAQLGGLIFGEDFTPWGESLGLGAIVNETTAATYLDTALFGADCDTLSIGVDFSVVPATFVD